MGLNQVVDQAYSLPITPAEYRMNDLKEILRLVFVPGRNIQVGDWLYEKAQPLDLRLLTGMDILDNVISYKAMPMCAEVAKAMGYALLLGYVFGNLK